MRGDARRRTGRGRSTRPPTRSSTCPTASCAGSPTRGRLRDIPGVGEQHRDRHRRGARRGKYPSTSRTCSSTPATPGSAEGEAIRAALRGDLHVHSNWSDGGDDDHRDGCKGARAWSRLHRAHRSLAPIEDRARLVTPSACASSSTSSRQLNEELAPFRMLTGIEVDILEDGELDQEPELLARDRRRRRERAFEVAHGRARHDGANGRAMANPHADILGHCTGRIVVGRGRPQSTFDVEAVFSTCAKNDKAVEINCRPERLDPPREMFGARSRWASKYRDFHRRPRNRTTRMAALRHRPRGGMRRRRQERRQRMGRRQAARLVPQPRHLIASEDALRARRQLQTPGRLATVPT